MKKAAVTAIACLVLCCAMPAAAYAQELMVGGQAVGIQVGTKGVMVAGLSQVTTDSGDKCPASSAGIKKGDMITEINGTAVNKAAELIDTVSSLGGMPARLTIQRGDSALSVTVQPVQNSDGQWMMGMWLRDGVSGIGTITFYDPISGTFGALGHSINDADTGTQMPLGDGCITGAEIVSVTRGTVGAPGELSGCADVGQVLGSIDSNTAHGIFGKAYTALGTQRLETGPISTGSATIISTVSGTAAREYSVEINRIYHDSEGTHVMLTVTDPTLLAQTGGIVQGMSGSPIIQDGKLVGAVTHVFVNDPTRGYGIYIENMLDAAG